MISLMKAIYEAIESNTDLKVYADKAPKNSEPMPYITYSIVGTTSDYGRYDSTVAVNIWDNKEDIEVLETKAEELFKALDLYTKTTEFVGITMYADSVLTIPDPELTIHRKQLIFNVLGYIK